MAHRIGVWIRDGLTAQWIPWNGVWTEKITMPVSVNANKGDSNCGCLLLHTVYMTGKKGLDARYCT